MKKPTRVQFIITSLVVMIVVAILWSMLWSVKFFGDSIIPEKGLEFGAFHIVFNTLFILSWLGIVGTLFADLDEKNDIYSYFYVDENKFGDEKEEKFTFKKKWIVWSILIICCFFLYGWIKTMTVQTISLYNKSKIYHNTYTQRVQEKAGFYDKLWKTYLQKEKITNINKETFLMVTKIIMENRKDGEKLTWKWIQENQQIPYDEFTKFYTDLSSFIASQREGYFNIEKDCQLIANQNNTMLDTFPNNIYNKLLGCGRIHFEYGFLSDSTDNVFKNKKENVK